MRKAGLERPRYLIATPLPDCNFCLARCPAIVLQCTFVAKPFGALVLVAKYFLPLPAQKEPGFLSLKQKK